MNLQMKCCMYVVASALYGHAQIASKMEFEVASVKPAPVFRGKMFIEGGPGSSDPGQITYHDRSLTELIYLAYDIKSFQASIPSWMRDEQFDIVAKVPAGATKADVRIMLRNLLVERFHLKTRHESRKTEVQVLTIVKDGPKMNAYPSMLPDDIVESTPRFRDGEDKNGFTIIPPGYSTGLISTREGITRFSFARVPVAFLCSAIASALREPVVDQTGLTGRYDVRLAFAKELEPGITPGPGRDGNTQEALEPAPTLFLAIEPQLGLKLQKKTIAVEFFVVDYAGKTPIEN